MSLSRRFSVALLACLLLAGEGVADIRDTKHNLSGKVLDSEQKAGMTSAQERQWLNREVCVFCHTPSVADEIALHGTQGAAAPQPQWQKSIGPEFAFDIFDDIGRLGGAGEDPVGSVSVACLSCHDNSQAFGVNAASDNHPFGIPYRGAMTATSSATTQTVNADPSTPYRAASVLLDASAFRPVRSGVINRRKIWWASMFDNGQRTKNDLPLYPRHESAGAGSPIPYVECTSCHDPHTTQTVFLRIANDQSKLCGTCHVK